MQGEHPVGAALSPTHLGRSGVWHPQGPIHPQPSPVPLHLARPRCPVHLSTAPSPGGGVASPDM